MKKFLNGKIMKRFILTSALVLSAGLMLSSCLKDDGYYGDYFYPNALVTAKTSDSGTFYFQLDDRTTLKPDNMVKSPYGDKEVRALVNFSDKGPWSGSEEDGLSFDRSVTINAIDSVRTKDAVVTLGDENDKVYGTAPISIIDNSWTVLEDGYLTMTFCAWWGDPRIYHEINLVTGTDPDNPNLVELRHNPLEDDIYYMGGIQATGIIAFRLDESLADADHLDIRFNSIYGGDKTWTIERNTDYYLGNESSVRSSSAEITENLAVR